MLMSVHTPPAIMVLIPNSIFALKTPLLSNSGNVVAGDKVVNNKLIGESAANKLPTTPMLELGTKQMPRPEVTTKIRMSVATIAPTEPFDRIDHNNPRVKQKAM